MMDDFRFITEAQWEPIVGRRAPPLRNVLTYEGFQQWIAGRFHVKVTNFFVSFSTFRDEKITGDNFINAHVQQQLSELVRRDLQKSPERVSLDMKDFYRRSDELIEVSQHLGESTIPLSHRFQSFSNIWRSFAPAYTFPLILEKVLEEAILRNYQDSVTAYTKLTELVTASVESKLFDLQRPIREADASYFDPKDAGSIALLKQLADLRDHRKYAYEKSWYELAASFFKELATATGLGQYIEWVSAAEIVRRLSTPEPAQTFPHECMVYERDGVHVVYGEHVDPIRSVVFGRRAPSELLGRVAFHGTVRGKARVLFATDPKELAEGEILVTKMTTPEYIPLISRCGGIVTDEGGVTCHAALVSREYKKPCIVGTQYATEVIRTGDFIEVNGDTGVVRKIPGSLHSSTPRR